MEKNLKLALPNLIKARQYLMRALSRYHYPTMHEDLDHAIRDVKDLLAALAKGETLPK